MPSNIKMISHQTTVSLFMIQGRASHLPCPHCPAQDNGPKNVTMIKKNNNALAPVHKSASTAHHHFPVPCRFPVEFDEHGPLVVLPQRRLLN